MPTYTYYCEACQITEDVRKALAVYDREEPCSKCQKIMQRRITAAALDFSKGGSGFFCNEYPKKTPADQ